MDKIILIGGSPTAGKSYTARKLAESLKLPWISTDTIREQMRQIVEKKDFPPYFFQESTPKMAVEFLNNNSAKQIVEYQNKESEEVWRGVKALIETDYVWGSFIVEGVAILPHLVNSLRIKNKKIITLFLIDENLKRVRKTIFTRGLWDDPDKYPDSVKEKEVEWVSEFNEYIKKEAKKYNLPVIKIGNRKHYIKEVKKIIR
jgi:2-phosphoglycerate kinase